MDGFEKKKTTKNKESNLSITYMYKNDMKNKLNRSNHPQCLI